MTTMKITLVAMALIGAALANNNADKVIVSGSANADLVTNTDSDAKAMEEVHSV